MDHFDIFESLRGRESLNWIICGHYVPHPENVMEQEVVENPELHRFELAIEGEDLALAYYRVDGNRVVLTHTEVPQQYAGRGIGSRLAKGVFDILRRTGRKAVVKCPFMGAWFSRHPDYKDVVDG